ncbi:MAG: hypothetical protein Q8J96_01575 [Rhodocyclaceae bacterium]|nr:hypothetical protein [Rhodocyclaceae bacterium]
MLFLNRVLAIRGGDPLEFIGFTKLISFLATACCNGRAALHTASAALATARGSHFHAVLPHAFQKEIDGTDSSNQHNEGYQRN